MTDPLGAAARGGRAPDADGLAVGVRETHTAVLWFLGDRVHKMKKPVDLGFCDFTDAWSSVGRPAAGRSRSTGVSAPRPTSGSRPSWGRPARPRSTWWPCAACRPTAASRPSCVRASPSRTTCGRSPGGSRDSTVPRPGGPAVTREGSREAARTRWEGVLDGLRRHAGALLPPDVVDRVAREATAFLDGRADLFAARRAEDRVVDGHGDLLADDVFCLPDGPVCSTASSSTTGCATSTGSTTPPSSPWTSNVSAGRSLRPGSWRSTRSSPPTRPRRP